MRRGALAALALAIAVAALAVSHVSTARADFSESFCTGGLAAAPWSVGTVATPWAETNDTCGELNGSTGWDMHANPLAVGSYSSGIAAPPGEVFTHETFDFSTQTDPDTDVFILFGYGQSTILNEYEDGAAGLNLQVDRALPDASLLWTRTDCDNSSGCALGNFINVLAIGPITLTVHDTGVPAVAPAGGSLAADGAVRGTQTLLYHATDTGSGVQKVTLSLGPAVLATVDSTCQAASLTPCPADTTGTLSADTRLLPDGTYPVILTAYDVSGDATPVQVSTVTVTNHTGTVSVPIATVRSARNHRRPLKVKAKFKWDWRGATTRLDFARFGTLPKGGHIALRCRGAHCPFGRLSTGRAGVGHLRRKLVRRVFRPGQTLEVTISAPHRAAERGRIVIRAGALPVVKAARAPQHHHKKHRA
jgi:hypothetical protein